MIIVMAFLLSLLGLIAYGSWNAIGVFEETAGTSTT